MPAENKFLNLSRDQLRDIGLGIGRGFQAYDPNNPFAGAGAALEATLASGMTRDMRAEDRQQRLDDLDRAERALIERERRAEESMKSREGRIEKMRERERSSEMAANLETEETIYQRQKSREKDERGAFRSIDGGLRQQPKNMTPEWMRTWFGTLGKFVKTTSGSSPIDVYQVGDPRNQSDDFDIIDPYADAERGYTPIGKVDESFNKKADEKRTRKRYKSFDYETQKIVDTEEIDR